ncbi:dTDP-4-dehydrorhamnose reductase [Asanoa ferruginea]|uniref:dTDP-4-dehydrorhamnose reductase n=1 Tax=Asanoa ferruginea TaxID=53367 RepID=A0A3D9ZRW4_9ACTN|nr:sugar nucleotide-binding protein [Asanoa ferruginea]REF98723.1 dTDP-4-dehydrorhamnose reductase [Asanoa ferruginea]GIF53314.1 NAD(P)-dependent oxidoreductase [Asanoa ferruginea]
MTVLVVGGSGYLGGEVCRQAVAAGSTVVATYRREPGEAPGARWERLDVRDGAAVDRLVTAVRPRMVVNVAYAYAEWATTATGAAHVAAAAARTGARLVHLSSDAVHGGRPEPYGDDDDPSPVFAYGAAKAAAETAVRALAPDAAVVRCSLIIGPDARSNQVAQSLRALDPESDLRLFRDEIRTPVGVADLAAAVLELAAGDYAGVLNVAGPEPLSRAELGELVARVHGLDPGRLRTTTVAESGMARAAMIVLDTTRAKEMLKTRLRPAAEVL